MTLVISSFKNSFRYLFQDKKNFTLALAPILIGLTLYILLGKWLFGQMNEFSTYMLGKYILRSDVSKYLYYAIMIIFSFLLFFLFNWTFVIVTALIASPFNSIISSRVERTVCVERGRAIFQEQTMTFWSLVSSLLNEVKKVFILIILSAFAFGLSYFPLLAPLTFVLSGILLSTQFIDYSWSRHELKASQCLGDYKNNFFNYLLSGLMFLFLLSIPLVNVFFIPLAVIHFTLLWLGKDERKGEVV